MKIINIGSLNTDYVYRVRDFVKPGETVACTSRQIFPGGKGLNQSVALAKAGAKVCHAGCIGSDGAMLRKVLEDALVDTRWLRESEEPGGHTVIQVSDAGQNCILLYGGTNQSLEKEYIDKVLSGCEADDVVVLQNEINLTSYAIEKACELGLRVALNASPADSSLLKCPLDKVKWLIVNELEGSAIAGSSEEPDAIAAAIGEKYPGCTLVLTLGSRGVRLCGEGEDIYMDAYHVENVVDTTAAGDTFLGYFLASAAGGMSNAAALKRAVTASTVAIQRHGASVSIPGAAEVDKAIADGRFEK